MIPDCVPKTRLSHLEFSAELPTSWTKELPILGLEILQSRLYFKTQNLATDRYRFIGEFEITATITCQICHEKFHDWLHLPLDICPIFSLPSQSFGGYCTQIYLCEPGDHIILKDLILHALKLQLPLMGSHNPQQRCWPKLKLGLQDVEAAVGQPTEPFEKLPCKSVS